MTIQDNGVGFERSDTLLGGSGLKGMQERIGFINGSLEIESDEGTTVVLKIPLAITHQKGENAK